MEKERLREVLDNLICWNLEVFKHNSEAVNDMVNAMDLTDEEIDELDLKEYVDENDEDDNEEDEEVEPGYKRVKWTDAEWDKRDKFADRVAELYGNDAYVNWCEEDDIVEEDDTRLTWITYKYKKDRDSLIELAKENGFSFSGDEEEITDEYSYYLYLK